MCYEKFIQYDYQKLSPQWFNWDWSIALAHCCFSTTDSRQLVAKLEALRRGFLRHTYSLIDLHFVTDFSFTEFGHFLQIKKQL